MAVELGSKVSGKVTSITKFGAFISLETKQTGLVHISEVSNTFVKDINDVLSVGDEVVVKVTAISEDGKISLSIRQAVDKPEPKPFPKRDTNYSDNRQEQAPRKSSQYFNDAAQKKSTDFDSLMSAFLKDSDDRLTSLKRNTEGKRGGRGGRRS